MNFARMAGAYRNSEHQAVIEAQDLQLEVQLLLEGLVKSLRQLAASLGDGADKGARAKQFSCCLMLLHALQSSLDLEKGDELAACLGQLYDYTRQQLFLAMRHKQAGALDTAIWSINEIRTAWQEAGRAATRPES